MPLSLELLIRPSGLTLCPRHLGPPILSFSLKMLWPSAALCCLFLFALRLGCPYLYETPRASKFAWARWWQRLARKLGVFAWFWASCMYGSPHRKEFRLLGANLSSRRLCHACSRDHENILCRALPQSNPPFTRKAWPSRLRILSQIPFETGNLNRAGPQLSSRLS